MKLNQLFATLAVITTLFGSSSSYAEPLLPESVPSHPKNIVIMVGDGMGPAYTSAYRYYQDNPDTQEIEQTVFDRLLVGNASTYPAAVSGVVTDSAAAATALATGVKTYNGAVSVNVDKKPIPTIMELAKKRGMSTGVAVTSQINHATPAAFLSHSESRRNYDELAKNYLTTDADVLLGGGQRYFPGPLIDQFKAKGYQYLSDFSKLDQLTTPKVIGLFADVQLPWAIDEPEANRLSKLTQKALDLLSQNDQGFVLLVEGSLIDWAGHNNDIATAMAEMHEFANAVEVVEQYIRSNNDTLLVITADHNTGGLSIGANDQYIWNGQALRNIKNNPEKIANDAIAVDNWETLIGSRLGAKLSQEEQVTLSNARMQGANVLHVALKKVIDKRSNTGWTTQGHTGGDVQVFASGPASTLFYGHQDNTDIANKLISLLPKVKTVASETSVNQAKPVKDNPALPSVVKIETSPNAAKPVEQTPATAGKAQ